MRKIIIYIVILSSTFASAQNISEAVRYSSLNQQSTARVAGVAGAFGAMGGDIGVVTINPAGIGDFRKSEFVLSPTIFSISTDADINGADNPTTTDLNSKLTMGALGIVFAGQPRGKKFQTSNFAITLNKRTTLRQRYAYDGLTQGSITQRFAERANGNDPNNLDQFEGLLAYNTGAIYDFEGNNNYDTDFKESTVVQKGQEIIRFGAINDINLTWGGKLSENINIGLGVGIPVVSYEEDKLYNERDEAENFIPAFNSLEYQENLITSGVGFNFRGGVQGELLDRFRVGLSMQSPTWFNLNDDYSSSLTYSFTESLDEGPIVATADSPNGSFRYRLKTPWQATGSVGMILRSETLNGFVNLDVEYIDYSNNQFDFEKFGGSLGDILLQNEANDAIFTELQNAVNLRLGGEVAYNKIRGRAGVAMISSPYSIQSGRDFALSAGFGFRFDGLYIDFAWSRRNQSEGYIPYLVLASEDNQVVTVDQRMTNIDISVGFKF